MGSKDITIRNVFLLNIDCNGEFIGCLDSASDVSSAV